MSPARSRERFAAARHALLATADRSGAPHIVPIVFALAGETIYNAVDRKPKRTTELRRLANARANPRAAVLVEHYSEDWEQLWWVRAEGGARVVAAEAPEGAAALELLAARYEHYRREPPPGPLLAIDVARWSGWSARGD
ncbi:MAG TPA: TIGR03668 family PPOX class F420-dependent oxidoreductase [Solirubrobacteraceae bacterium]|nr:TIGR03668 family PPOX class F420-dependent oxidoreductase [Solirubrobacteraceae bacterium]